MLAVGSWQLAVGSWQLAVGSWQLAVGSWQLAVGSWHVVPDCTLLSREKSLDKYIFSVIIMTFSFYYLN